MSYAIERSGARTTLRVSGRGRDEVFRDAVHALLEAAYEGPAGTDGYAGQVLPVQADGDTDERLLSRLLTEISRLASLESERLSAPRWLAFDEKRVTANLSLVPGKPARNLAVEAVHIAATEQETKAEITLSQS